MTQALDAAVRAVCEDKHSRCDWPTCRNFCWIYEGEAKIALHAALPADPPVSYLSGCYEDGMSDGQAREAWRLVRVHLLGEAA